MHASAYRSLGNADFSTPEALLAKKVRSVTTHSRSDYHQVLQLAPLIFPQRLNQQQWLFPQQGNPLNPAEQEPCLSSSSKTANVKRGFKARLVLLSICLTLLKSLMFSGRSWLGWCFLPPPPPPAKANSQG